MATVEDGGTNLCIPPLCYGMSSVSGSAGKQNVNSDYRSVTEQSGIRAGDGGLPDGSSISIHYQYNSITGKAYDIKIGTPQPSVLQPDPSFTSKK